MVGPDERTFVHGALMHTTCNRSWCPLAFIRRTDAHRLCWLVFSSWLPFLCLYFWLPATDSVSSWITRALFWLHGSAPECFLCMTSASPWLCSWSLFCWLRCSDLDTCTWLCFLPCPASCDLLAVICPLLVLTAWSCIHLKDQLPSISSFHLQRSHLYSTTCLQYS